jgi:oligopeptide transport system substrate-binding protein
MDKKLNFVRTCFIIVTVALMVSVLTGCGPEKQAEKQSLRVVLGTEPESMDPHKCSSLYAANYLKNMIEGLAVLDAKNQPQPGAAKGWDVSADGMKYVFHLRKNKWSNGEPVTAHDFVYAWKRILAPEFASVYAFMLYPIKGAEAYNTGKGAADKVGIKALDDETLQVELCKPTAYFLSLCTHHATHPVCKKVVESNPKWAANPKTFVANGPFKFKEWVHNNKIVVEKNENYWNKDVVKLANITYVLSDNSTTAMALFDNKELDLLSSPPLSEMERLKKDGVFHISDTIYTGYYDFNNKKAPFDNKKVRKAFAMAIDRKTMGEKLYYGVPIPATGWVPMGFYNSVTKKDFREEGGILLKYDPEKARQLLAEAGYPGGKGLPPITLQYTTGVNNKKDSEAVQEMWLKNLGVKVELRNQEWKVFCGTRIAGDYQVAIAGWMGDYFDPMTFMNYFLSYNSQNYGKYSNQAYDALVEKAQNSNNQKERMEAMHAAEKIFMDDMGLAPHFFARNFCAKNPKLKDVICTGNNEYDFKYAYLE